MWRRNSVSAKIPISYHRPVERRFIYVIPHGVDIERFEHLGTENEEESADQRREQESEDVGNFQETETKTRNQGETKTKRSQKKKDTGIEESDSRAPFARIGNDSIGNDSVDEREKAKARIKAELFPLQCGNAGAYRCAPCCEAQDIKANWCDC